MSRSMRSSSLKLEPGDGDDGGCCLVLGELVNPFRFSGFGWKSTLGEVM